MSSISTSLTLSSSSSTPTHVCILLAAVCYVITAIFPIVWFVRVLLLSKRPSEESKTLLTRGSQEPRWVCICCLSVFSSSFSSLWFCNRDADYGLHGFTCFCSSVQQWELRISFLKEPLIGKLGILGLMLYSEQSWCFCQHRLSFVAILYFLANYLSWLLLFLLPLL